MSERTFRKNCQDFTECEGHMQGDGIRTLAFGHFGFPGKRLILSLALLRDTVVKANLLLAAVRPSLNYTHTQLT